MSAVKGAVLSLLLDAYQRRDKVGLITFRGAGAELALPPDVVGRGRRRPAGAAADRRPHAAGRRAAAGPRGAAGRAAAGPRAPPAAGRRHRRPGDRRPRAGGAGRPRGPAAGRRRAPPRSSWTARPARCGSGWPARWPASWAAPRSRSRSCARTRVSALVRTGRLQEGRVMPQGQPSVVPGRRTHHPAAPQPAAGVVHTGAGQGQVDRRLRAGAARLEPGLADRGVPVRQVGEVAGRRGARRCGCSATSGEGGTVAWHKMGEGWSWVQRGIGRPARTRRARAGSRSSGTWPPRPTGCYVLDEFTYPMKWGWVDVDEVVAVLRDRPGTPARRDHRPQRARRRCSTPPTWSPR